MAGLVSVPIANEPGALAKVTTVLSQGGIAIDGVTLVARGAMGEATFLVKDADRCLKTLQGAGFSGKSIDVLVITLSNHQGALADVCTRLAKAGINIEGFFGTTYGKAGTLALVTNDNKAARRILDQLSAP